MLPEGGENRLVTVENRRPTSLLHRGSHFRDASAYRRQVVDQYPMNIMMAQVASTNLMRSNKLND